jgi:hypothetical protein
MDERLLVLLIIDGIFFISWSVMTILSSKLNISEKQRNDLFDLVKYVTFAIVGYQVAIGGVITS